VARTYLEFERPLAELDARLDALRHAGGTAAEVRRLEAARRALLRRIARGLSAWERVQLARHVDRPQTLEYLAELCQDFFELHGDRAFRDDPAIVAGLGRTRRGPVAVVGHQRGHGTRERVWRSFGMASPEGYRKAVRVFRLAERLGIPVVTFVDTQGAYPGVGAEERGLPEAIARSLRTMAGLRVPIVTVVIGEGGSGGALALGVADRVLMQEYACYSVISPEGCAGILYRERSSRSVARAAEALRLTAGDLHGFGLVDEIVPEPAGGAHRAPARAVATVAARVLHHLQALARETTDGLVAARDAKYRHVGAHLE
jgi:acetyl-CoA carboxylase carboxyl transferase subunit alpha